MRVIEVYRQCDSCQLAHSVLFPCPDRGRGSRVCLACYFDHNGDLPPPDFAPDERVRLVLEGMVAA